MGSEGVVLVRPTDKVVLAEYPYSNIAALLMDPVDNGLTISLTHHGQHDGHRYVVLGHEDLNTGGQDGQRYVYMFTRPACP